MLMLTLLVVVNGNRTLETTIKNWAFLSVALYFSTVNSSPAMLNFPLLEGDVTSACGVQSFPPSHHPSQLYRQPYLPSLLESVANAVTTLFLDSH